MIADTRCIVSCTISCTNSCTVSSTISSTIVQSVQLDVRDAHCRYIADELTRICVDSAPRIGPWLAALVRDLEGTDHKKNQGVFFCGWVAGAFACNRRALDQAPASGSRDEQASKLSMLAGRFEDQKDMHRLGPTKEVKEFLSVVFGRQVSDNARFIQGCRTFLTDFFEARVHGSTPWERSDYVVGDHRLIG